jgi:hypothetical protein
MVGNQEGETPLEGLDADERIIVKYILEKQDGVSLKVSIWRRMGTSDRPL